MLKERREAAKKVADCLFAVEEAIDLALTRAAELNAAMPAARADARVSALVGQQAMDRAARAFTLLVQARGEMCETHRCLDETKTQIGLREFAVGDLLPKPKTLVEGRQESHVRAVA